MVTPTSFRGYPTFSSVEVDELLEENRSQKENPG